MYQPAAIWSVTEVAIAAVAWSDPKELKVTMTLTCMDNVVKAHMRQYLKLYDIASLDEDGEFSLIVDPSNITVSRETGVVKPGSSLN